MRRTIIFFIWVFALIQIVRVEYTNPISLPDRDMIALENPPDEVTKILKKSCYNCHSNETKWPWYGQVAPFSWWMTHHVSEARRHFNFSEWDEVINERHRDRFIEEAEYEILEGDMPLPPFTWMHQGTRLSDEEKDILIDWLVSL